MFLNLSFWLTLSPIPPIVRNTKDFVLMLRRIDGSSGVGVLISFNARPRLLGNEIWDNVLAGVRVSNGGDPFLSGNIIRDHAGMDGVGVLGVGVLVQQTSHGLATILPDNVFLRNTGGDVVRAPAPLPI